MPLSTDVNLPKQHPARFPDKCVVCGGPPNTTVRLITGSIGWWTWLLWWFGMPFMVRVPTCTTCGWKLHLQRWLSLLLTIGVTVAVYFLIWPLVSDQVPRALRKWVMMGLALLCLMPLFLYEVFKPAAISITAYSDSVDYEFRNEELALEFAALNQDAEWVKIS
jgi:hypothetical protein